MKKKAPNTKEPELKVISIASIDDLDKMLREPIHVKFPLGGGLVDIECFRLRPVEAQQIERILNGALPPLVDDGDGKSHYDITDPEYLDRKAKAQNEARALTVYLACPLYQAKFPGLKSPQEIAEKVNSLLTEEVLRLIANTVSSENGLVPRMANFF
ncbi:MAG TPA: hypothetical protein VGH19_06725 [Verrucomicrobiae bacterium]